MKPSLNSPFWRYARMMLAYRGTVVLALVMAFVSAGSLGVGLIGLVVILQRIIGDDPTGLRQQATAYNENNLDGLIPGDLLAMLPTEPYDSVVLTVIILGALTVFGGAANFLHMWLTFTASARTVGDIRQKAFEHTVRLPLGEVVKSDSSDRASRIVADTDILNRGFQAITGKAVAQATKGLASAIVAVLVQWQVALVLITVGPAMAVIIRKLGKRVKKASRGAMRGRAGLLFRTNEVLTGFRVVKVYSTEQREAARFEEQNRNVVREVLRERTARALASPLIEVIAVIILGTLAVIASKAIIEGSLEPARFFGAMTGLAMAGASLKPLTGVIQNIQAAEAAAKRIDHLFALEPEKPGESDLPDLPRHGESIEFEGVTFAYESTREPAIDGVSLRIEHGQTVAFVGPNGCGKTTLLSLVPRLFEPTSGRLLVDGRPVSEYSLASLRTQIGVVTQETVIFRGTVAQNIAYSRPDATREMVEKAAKLAHAEGFIEALPDGYDTQLGDQGLTLSGGQRQRLSIARAILRDPSILILDEATSMIDAKSESDIASAIEDFSKGRTTLIVAHRLSTVLGADRIVVMAGGRVIETGTHESLLESCDLYRELASHQLAPDTTKTPQPTATEPSTT